MIATIDEWMAVAAIVEVDGTRKAALAAYATAAQAMYQVLLKKAGVTDTFRCERGGPTERLQMEAALARFRSKRP